MAKKEQGPKVLLEREYNVPLRHGWLKVPEYKRANKAVKTLKEFLVKHMKVYDRDLRKIKVDIILNNEIRFRGMKKPPAKIKVKAVKFDDGNVIVSLVNIPEHIKFELARKAKEEVSKKKAAEEKKKIDEAKKAAEAGAKKEDEGEKTEEEKTDEKEKKKSTVEAGLKMAKQAHNIQKHTTKGNVPIIQRKALAK